MTEPIRFTVPILQIDTPTATGLIYPRAVVERAVSHFKDRIEKGTQVLGTIRDGTPTPKYVKPREEVSHRITRVWIEGEVVRAELEVLHTPLGAVLENHIRHALQHPELVTVGGELTGKGDYDRNWIVQPGYIPLSINAHVIYLAAPAMPTHAPANEAS